MAYEESLSFLNEEVYPSVSFEMICEGDMRRLEKDLELLSLLGSQILGDPLPLLVARMAN